MARDWYKVRRGWRDSPSHKRLSGDALALGPSTLFYLADPNWEPGQSEAPLLDAGDGTPITLEEIAAEARWPVRRVAKAMAELERVGTLEKRGNVWLFPNYGLHQETPAARRMREKREREKRNSDATSDANSYVNSDRHCASTSTSISSLTEIQKRVVSALSEAMAIPLGADAYIVQDACKRVANRDYAIDDLPAILRAAQDGLLAAEPLKVFQKKHVATVHRVVLGRKGIPYTC